MGSVHHSARNSGTNFFGGADRLYTSCMGAAVAQIGTVTTVIAGMLLGALSLETFGAPATLVGFSALFLLANATRRATSRLR
jgi:hypothetical protein